MPALGDIPANADLENGGGLPVGAVIAYAGVALPGGGIWAWADGSLVDRTVNGTLFARVGHAYNGGVDPGNNKMRLPDKRGRVPMGADNFGAGAGGRIPTEVTAGRGARGSGGGSERVQLASAESGVPAHGHTDAGHPHGASTGAALSGIFPLEYPAFTDQWLNNGLAAATGGGGGAWNPPLPMASGAANRQAWNGGPDLNHGHGVTVNNGNAAIQNNAAAGAASAHQNLQPYEADNYIVRIA